MQTGRNESCPCGSGKKFKNCCIGEAKRRAARGPVFLIAALGALAIAGILPTLMGEKQPQQSQQLTAPATSTAGKVWSAEHGHWHDAAAPAGTPSPIQASTVPVRPATTSVPVNAPKPQPGPAPEGKVWSAEHGHWHDVAAPKK